MITGEVAGVALRHDSVGAATKAMVAQAIRRSSSIGRRTEPKGSATAAMAVDSSAPRSDVGQGSRAAAAATAVAKVARRTSSFRRRAPRGRTSPTSEVVVAAEAEVEAAIEMDDKGNPVSIPASLMAASSDGAIHIVESPVVVE